MRTQVSPGGPDGPVAAPPNSPASSGGSRSTSADTLRRRAKLYADLAALASNPDTAARLRGLAERFGRDADAAEASPAA